MAVNAYPVDERDAVQEQRLLDWRIMLLRPGRRVSAFNVDAATYEDAAAWALSLSQ